MTIFAQILNNVVINIIVADQEFINTLSDPQNYVVTTTAGIGCAYVDGVFIEPPPAPFVP